MNKEEKYTSLELSKKIYELAKKKGIELESEYYWIVDNETGEKALGKPSISPKLLRCKKYSYYSALDTAEWGMILSYRIMDKKTERYLNVYKIISGEWIVNYELGRCIQKVIWIKEKTMPEAMGQMYFYLLDNNLL